MNSTLQSAPKWFATLRARMKMRGSLTTSCRSINFANDNLAKVNNSHKSIFTRERITKSTGVVEQELKAKQMKVNIKNELKEPYFAKFCIAVIGSPDSGKEDILNKEVYGDNAVYGESTPDTKIKIYTKRYWVDGKCLHVEFWSAPENLQWIVYTSRCVSGLAGTMYVVDVTQANSMTAIKEWINEFEGLGSDSMGISKVLIGNRVNLPGKRQIFQEDIEDFAFQKGMDCFETSASDDQEIIHEFFQKVVAQIYNQIPPECDRLKPSEGKIANICPIGLQLDLAIEPTQRHLYKVALIDNKIIEQGTTVVDWLTERRGQ